MPSRLVSIILPAHNEALTIAATLQDVVRTFTDASSPRPDAVELIVVDDGSTDETADTVRRLQPSYPQIRVMHHDARRGKGYSLRCGIEAAGGELVAFLDADGAIPASECKKLLDGLEAHPELGLVIGSKRLKGSTRIGAPVLSRLLLRRLGNALVRRLLVPGIRDTQCGVKAFRGSVIKSLSRSTMMEGWSFDVELLALAYRAGYVIREEPITWRETPTSHLRPLDYLKTLGDLVRIWWQIRHHGERAPARS